MPPKFCPNCRGTSLQADYASGRIECQDCGYIAEENILVSEVGFAEGAGGRIHVQGAFVSNHATGLGGLRGRNSQQSTENIKSQGQMRITHVAQHMGLNHSVRQGAVRLFALAVDSNFHRGRRKDYVVASCLYLQSRMKREPHMLIDFSERLQINVFELGGTYLKLRSTLHLPDPMPMTDPAIYSLRFANRLDLGSDKHKVATDASRLVRRFQADWMSEGRRPAGVCGACLLVAARMNGYHRTPEEIAQIVKISPDTIKRRLLEFAKTDMANKTVQEWKNMSDADLAAPGEMQPPVVRQQQAREDKKRRKLNKGGRSQSAQQSDDEDQQDGEEEEGDAERQRLVEAKQSQMESAIKAAVEQLDELGDDEDEERDLAPPAPDQYVRDLDAAGDDPESAQNERAKAVRKFRRLNKVASTGGDEADLDELQEQVEDIEGGEEEEDDEGADAAGEQGDEEDVEEGEKDDDDDGVDKQDPGTQVKSDVHDPRFRHFKFDQWDDPLAVRKHAEERYMPRIRLESALTDKHVEDRLQLWLGVRDPREIFYELEIVNRAHRRRERESRADPESDFSDVDDDEIDGIWQMTEDEQRTRARMWLSHNGRWLEEDKEKQLKRAEYERDNHDKIARKKAKRKNRPAKRTQPFRTPQEAMGDFMTQKNFSSRINVAAFKEMGLDMTEGMHDGLQVMDDDKDDDEKEDDTEKHDSGYANPYSGFDYGDGDQEGDAYGGEEYD